jgi:hypothetical protein
MATKKPTAAKKPTACAHSSQADRLPSRALWRDGRLGVAKFMPKLRLVK